MVPLAVCVYCFAIPIWVIFSSSESQKNDSARQLRRAVIVISLPLLLAVVPVGVYGVVTIEQARPLPDHSLRLFAWISTGGLPFIACFQLIREWSISRA